MIKDNYADVTFISYMFDFERIDLDELDSRLVEANLTGILHC